MSNTTTCTGGELSDDASSLTFRLGGTHGLAKEAWFKVLSSISAPRFHLNYECSYLNDTIWWTELVYRLRLRDISVIVAGVVMDTMDGWWKMPLRQYLFRWLF